MYMRMDHCARGNGAQIDVPFITPIHERIININLNFKREVTTGNQPHL